MGIPAVILLKQLAGWLGNCHTESDVVIGGY